MTDDSTIPQRGATRYRFGFDIGGTFTDFVLIDSESGRIASYKTLTTPDRPSEAVMEGWRTLLDEVGAAPGDVETAIHGTTLITNAFIERKGAVTLLITTDGFSDVLDMQREMRYDIYDLHAPPVQHLIPRPLRFEVQERLDAFGEVIEPLACNSLEEMLALLKQAGVTDRVGAVAVCLLALVHEPGARAAGGRVAAHATYRRSASRCRTRWRRRFASTSG